jgi:hypothetical protein
MDTKRILPWRGDDRRFYSEHVCMAAKTDIGSYGIIDDTECGEKFAWMLEEARWEYSKMYGLADTLDAAMDACEADYLARCTEFLRLAGPGEVVVAGEDVARLVRLALASCPERARVGSCESCKPTDCEIHRITAAIDAAKGEWK